MQKREKKLALHKETLANLKLVKGGVLYQNQFKEQASGGGDICWFSDCNPCD